MNASKKISDLGREGLFGWLPLAAVSAAILRAAVWQPQEVPRFLFPLSDKVLHGMEFFLLALTAYQAFRLTSWKWIHEKRFFAVPFYSAGLAYLSEWVQIQVPGRYFEVTDLGADAVGILGAMGLLYFSSRMREKS